VVSKQITLVNVTTCLANYLQGVSKTSKKDVQFMILPVWQNTILSTYYWAFS